MKNPFFVLKPLLALLLVGSAVASESYSLRVGWGIADKNDFGEILSGEGEFDTAKTHVLGIDAGYLLAENLWDKPIDLYLNGALYHFYENGYQKDFWEAVIYLKGYYNVNMWDNRLRIGAGEGFSFAERVPIVEQNEALHKGSDTSRVLNYLDVSVDVDVGRLFGGEKWKDFYLGYALKHRSGIFGLINNVRKGGSNYDMIYLEKRF